MLSCERYFSSNSTCFRCRSRAIITLGLSKPILSRLLRHKETLVISKYVGYTHVVVLLLIAAGWGQTGIVNTFAGGGSALRNNVSAREASLCNPLQTAVNSSSDIYLTSFCQHVVYRFDHATNRLSIVAGDGTQNSLLFPMGVVLDKADNLYIIDGSKIRRLDAQTQTLSVIASEIGRAHV